MTSNGEHEQVVPILTSLDLDEAARFYARLGFEVGSRYDEYLILCRASGVEVHLSLFPDHDPHRTAGSIYLRVPDVQAVYESVRRTLDEEGVLYLAPASGLTPELAEGLRARIAAGERPVRLHEVEDKPWGMREFAVVDLDGNLVRVGNALT